MKKILKSRREFIKNSSLGGLGTLVGENFRSFSLNEGGSTTVVRNLSIHPRYYRWHVDEGVEWLETNTGYATLNWTIPVSQAALVLVDVWQRHYIKDTEKRTEEVINNTLIPLITACRKYGLQLIHAPSAPVAKLHSNWVNLVKESEMHTNRDTWPPAAFRNLSGVYQSYSRPVEPREAERQSLPALTFHPKIVPVGRETVVASGEELHRYCKQKGILFLLYAGFNTNACILSRDYGTIQMSNRGYQVVMVRDCTTGMESKDTQPTLSQTNGAILLLEMFGQYSITSNEVINGLQSLL